MTQYDALGLRRPAERAEFGGYPDKQTMDKAMADTGAFNEQRLLAAGQFVYANGLAQATTATVVDGQGDTPVLTDGPYLESKEYLGGFWVIEAALTSTKPWHSPPRARTPARARSRSGRFSERRAKRPAPSPRSGRRRGAKPEQTIRPSERRAMRSAIATKYGRRGAKPERTIQTQ